MYIQSPNEALVNRLLISLDRSQLEQWTGRLFAPDALLHLSGGPTAELRGSAVIVDQYLQPLRAQWPGRSLIADVDVALAGEGATLAFKQADERHELFVHVGGGRIDELWSYPSDRPPPAVLEMRAGTAEQGGASCSCCDALPPGT